MKRYVAFLLVLSASTVNATNDTYDAVTGILTIPSVTVGNTTYTNVVLKERSFDVISFDPYPSTGQISNGFLWTFNGCYLQQHTVTCNITVMSQNQDRSLNFCGGPYTLSDDVGNHYNASSLQIGNNTNTSCPIISFIANVSTPIQAVFNNISRNATAASQLFITSNNSNSSSITITNSPFINSAPPNPF